MENIVKAIQKKPRISLKSYQVVDRRRKPIIWERMLMPEGLPEFSLQDLCDRLFEDWEIPESKRQFERNFKDAVIGITRHIKREKNATN